VAAEDPASSEPEQNTIGGGHVEGPSIFLRKGRAVLEEALAGARESKDWQSLGDAAHDLAVLVGWGDGAVEQNGSEEGGEQGESTQNPDVFSTVAKFMHRPELQNAAVSSEDNRKSGFSNLPADAVAEAKAVSPSNGSQHSRNYPESTGN